MGHIFVLERGIIRTWLIAFAVINLQSGIFVMIGISGSSMLKGGIDG